MIDGQIQNDLNIAGVAQLDQLLQIRLTAEAEKDATIMRAEATKTAMQLIAEAEAAYVAKLSETLGAEGATKALLNRQTLDAYKAITANPSDKVFLPANLPAMLNVKE